MLAVEDPQDPTNDLGKGTYHFSKVRAAFDYAYSLLTASVSSDESLLRRLFRCVSCTQWHAESHAHGRSILFNPDPHKDPPATTGTCIVRVSNCV